MSPTLRPRQRIKKQKPAQPAKPSVDAPVQSTPVVQPPKPSPIDVSANTTLKISVDTKEQTAGTSASQATDTSREGAFSQKPSVEAAKIGSARPISNAPKGAREQVKSKPTAQQKMQPKHRLAKRIALGVCAFVVIGVVVAFCILRWCVNDDVADFQGTWYIAGSDVPVEITDTDIKLTDDVSYAYTIDPISKTIVFTFTTYEGTGKYRFSPDRQSLAIMDGQFSGFDTFWDDALWMSGALIGQISGSSALPMDGENVTQLTRTPSSANN